MSSIDIAPFIKAFNHHLIGAWAAIPDMVESSHREYLSMVLLRRIYTITVGTPVSDQQVIKHFSRLKSDFGLKGL